MNFYPICLNCATERRTYLGPGTSSASSGRSPRIRVDTPGFRTPGSRLDSTRGPAVTRGVQLQGFDFAMFQAGSGGAGFQVASQKSGPVASDVPRFARQHTNVARKEPETAVGWTPAGPLLDTGVQKAPVNAKGRASLPAHSPHLAFGIARSCCRCRREKCCNTLESLTHSVAPRSWSAPAASVAMRSCGRIPSRR